jgi:hypothetical protein
VALLNEKETGSTFGLCGWQRLASGVYETHGALLESKVVYGLFDLMRKERVAVIRDHHLLLPLHLGRRTL